MSGGHTEHPSLTLVSASELTSSMFVSRIGLHPSPHIRPLNQDVLNSGGPLAASSTLCALRPTMSSPHHCLALPAVPLALSPPLTPSSINPLGLLCACTPCPPPWLHTSLLAHPGFLGSPQCVSHSLSQLCLFTHPTLMEQVLCRTVIDSMVRNLGTCPSGLITQSMRRLSSQ